MIMGFSTPRRKPAAAQTETVIHKKPPDESQNAAA
jgi:hypothetical protein